MHNRAAHVATTALEVVVSSGSVCVSDIDERLETEVSSSTINRVLRQLERDGWLYRKAENAKTWYPGDQAQVMTTAEKP